MGAGRSGTQDDGTAFYETNQLQKNTTDYCNTRGPSWQAGDFTRMPAHLRRTAASHANCRAPQTFARYGVCENLHAEITSAQAARPRYAALCC